MLFNFKRTNHLVIFPALFSLTILSLTGCAAFRSIRFYVNPVKQLQDDIDSVLSDSIFVPGRASVKVASLDRKEVLYERDSKMLMRPASNMKLLTSSTAIALLGKDYQFKTDVMADTSLSDGVLNGNLYIKGFGNPDLKTSDLDTLASQIKSAGITSVKGKIVADVSFFDDLFWGSGWMWDDEPDPDEMFITPLSINKNCIFVIVTPGQSAGDSVKIETDPPTHYVAVINNAKTVKDTVINPLSVTRLFKEHLNTIIVEGEVLAGATPSRRKLSVWRPELYAAQLLKERLERDSIAIGSEPVIGAAPPYANVIATHAQRLDSMVVNLNKISDNLSAENTLKTLSAVKRGTPGNAASGINIVYEFLSSLGIDTTQFHMVDGSGVSHYNLLTTEMLEQLLEEMAQKPDFFPLLYQSLPIAGVDGTIGTRMNRTPAEGNLRAKTGSISGVSSLSGYVKTADGERLVFSIMMQNFIGASRRYRDAQDKIGALLAGFSRTR
ncbi:MAG: D-alanyl-D-alanine carboxypeptidase/D-alanyl-D-alanine-endopeptidase [Ignavibacteriales bacterium]|nr:D-alanyl-D-alanine carboxypeptidase/D-alanyl-D-alanine-endopeptidase [Ignavibacteriales bacterium]